MGINLINGRILLTEDDLNQAFAGVGEKLMYRADQKGMHTMASSHEILGVIQSAAQKYCDGVNAKAPAELKVEALRDIAVASILGIASIQNGKVDW